MKKIIFFFLFVLWFMAFTTTQALAETCQIQYSFDYIDPSTYFLCWPDSGSIATLQTYKTETAAEELSDGLGYPCLTSSGAGCEQEPFADSWANNCYSYDVSCGYNSSFFSINKHVCLDGTFHITEIALRGFSTSSYGHWDVVCATLIKLTSFTATPKSGKVIIRWNTESETDNAGFNLYKAESVDGTYIKINPALIPAQGSSTQGASYEFIDTNVQNRKTYYYKLEDIDLNGVSTMHGPVNATPRLIYRIGK
jgi:hypothetical protein